MHDKIAAFVGTQKEYKPNKHRIDDAVKAQIRERWAGFERYAILENSESMDPEAKR